MSAATERPMPCNPDRFIANVGMDEAQEHGYCRCCGRRIRYLMGEDGTPDGYCRWCERGHPKRQKLERPRLFS